VARKHLTKSRIEYLKSYKLNCINNKLCWVCVRPNTNGLQKCDKCREKHRNKYNKKICIVCNKPAFNKFCSKKCQSIVKTKTIECLNCKAKTRNKKYCNTICFNLYRTLAKKPKTKISKEEHSRRTSIGLREKWANDRFYRSTMIIRLNEILKSNKRRETMAYARQNQPKISSIQKTLYSMLDDLGVKYTPEAKIGPYTFDCLIQRDNKPTLLIECQGDYWHSLDKVIKKDAKKCSYITNLPNYELKYLWEHEFGCKDKIIETIRYWLNINSEILNFNKSDVIIKQCLAEQYKLLLSKYHYLPNAGRGGIAYGAFKGDELIAVCIFSPLIRQNTPDDKDSTRELSRLCINPKYNIKNFASWFISKCIKKLNKKYTKIISYCDTTFNHNGAVYKACNFKFVSTIKPDYWYVSNDGWMMHKKTLYNKAVNMSMSESEFAIKNGYKKTYGLNKLKYEYTR
jgi:hypothetical protein